VGLRRLRDRAAGRIDETTLDQQLDSINTGAAGLQSGIDAAERSLSVEDRAKQLRFRRRSCSQRYAESSPTP